MDPYFYFRYQDTNGNWHTLTYKHYNPGAGYAKYGDTNMDRNRDQYPHKGRYTYARLYADRDSLKHSDVDSNGSTTDIDTYTELDTEYTDIDTILDANDGSTPTDNGG